MVGAASTEEFGSIEITELIGVVGDVDVNGLVSVAFSDDMIV